MYTSPCQRSSRERGLFSRDSVVFRVGPNNFVNMPLFCRGPDTKVFRYLPLSAIVMGEGLFLLCDWLTTAT